MKVDKMDLQNWINDLILNFMNDPARNRLAPDIEEPAFDTPLIGYCRGDDPIFDDFKCHIGSFYWTPADFFRLAFPGHRHSPDKLTVISWVLPQMPATRAENRKCRTLPGLRWSQARHYGENVNHALKQHLETELLRKGIPAAGPVLSSHWNLRRSDTCGIASNWSERHAAHACGLGTFGLCDGLITPKGKAVRIGSVIAALSIDSTPRPYSGLHDWCLFYADGSCTKCIQRCPVGAISRSGHDKEKCRAYAQNVIAPYVETNQLGVKAYGCGLCQVGVPCESAIPVRKHECHD